MFQTNNSLPEPTREQVVGMLNQTLADLSTLKSYVKQAHWTLKGPLFYPLHLLFDEIAGELEVFVDDVAERAMALGGTVDGTVQDAAKNTSLPVYPKPIQGLDHARALADSLGTCGTFVRAAIDRCLALKDNDTADLYTEISRQLDKRLWFIESHLQR